MTCLSSVKLPVICQSPLINKNLVKHYKTNSHILLFLSRKAFFSSSTLSKKLFPRTPEVFFRGLPTLNGLERPWLELKLGEGEDGALGFIDFGWKDPKSRLSSLARPFLSGTTKVLQTAKM